MRVGALATLAAGILFAAAGCGSSEDSSAQGGVANSGGAGGVAGGGAPGTNGGVPAAGSGGGLGLSFGGNRAGGPGDVEACAETAQKGELVPLDIYIMLDVSGSMLDPAGSAATAPTKWEAVKRALQAFLNDPSSSGIGVGIQYFPLTDPTVPESCTTDAECGTHGPCFTRFCRQAAGFFACAANSDCVNASGQNLGPCAVLTYCYPATTQLLLCHDASECGLAQQCVPFNECSGNTDYSCPTAGAACTSGGMNLGTCRAFTPESYCVHNSLCTAGGYAVPAVDIQALPGAAAGLAASINAAVPAGNTPTAPALAGAIDKARSFARTHAGHRVVTLLATDGLPTECIADPATDPSGIAGVRDTARTGVAGTPSIATFVIGVFGPEDTSARTNLNQIAMAGGTSTAFMVDTSGDVTAQFVAALNAIRGSQLACEYQLPAPASGNDELDFSKVNVDFTNAGTRERVLAVANAMACDPATGGWYYDVVPGAGATPTKIMICPASCSRFEAAQSGSVQIALGCQTRVR